MLHQHVYFFFEEFHPLLIRPKLLVTVPRKFVSVFDSIRFLLAEETPLLFFFSNIFLRVSFLGWGPALVF